ncbi:hypothetical protein GCM10023186_20150 [Hymenobacter koreensis]|uniref:Uncharacterized protein n=1 Tax=Hymenobacter koreensis TaxID=1084523 RepID=A0ABP8IZR6_9BACT
MNLISQKDPAVRDLIDHFMSLFGPGSFTLRDYWDGDACAIGFESLNQRQLIYVNSFNRRPFHYYVDLEDVSNSHSYSVIQNIENASIAQVEELMRRYIIEH